MLSLADGVRSVQETGKDAFQCFWIMSRMGLDLDIGYCVLSVNLVFVGSFIVGDVEIKELQGFLTSFGINRVFDVDGVFLIQYSLKRSSGV